jgi:hypothetical protein
VAEEATVATKYADLFTALAAPFDSTDIKSRPQQGRQLHYITARTVMNRLDTVVGPENWWDEYIPSENSVLCRLTIRLPNGETLTKCDAGGYAGMADSGDDDKSGYSDAFKRAAVKFAVGRHLYRDGVPHYESAAASPAPAPAPAAAAPAARPSKAKPPAWGGDKPADSAPASSPAPSASAAPANGKAFLRWCQDQEKARGVKMVQYLTIWGGRKSYPDAISHWNPKQVAAGFEQACRKLASMEPENQTQEAAAE